MYSGDQVDSENRPVTGVRLYLEGRKSDRLAIHLQHLSSVPKTLELSDDFGYKHNDEPIGKGYLEPVKWSIFSHVCTVPVEYNETRIDDSASIVTKAWFEVKGVEDPPGYWVVTGAKLCVEGGRIRVKVKFSLLTIMSEDSMFM
nr:hypothetical protein [Tanacetum cinerariifolium]